MYIYMYMCHNPRWDPRVPEITEDEHHNTHCSLKMNTITWWLSIVAGSCGQVHRNDASWRIKLSDTVLKPWRESELVWHWKVCSDGSLVHEQEAEKHPCNLVSNSHLSRLPGSGNHGSDSRKLKSLRYPVSSIKYQVSGIRYRIPGIRYQVPCNSEQAWQWMMPAGLLMRMTNQTHRTRPSLPSQTYIPL